MSAGQTACESPFHFLKSFLLLNLWGFLINYLASKISFIFLTLSFCFQRVVSPGCPSLVPFTHMAASGDARSPFSVLFEMSGESCVLRPPLGRRLGHLKVQTDNSCFPQLQNQILSPFLFDPQEGKGYWWSGSIVNFTLGGKITHYHFQTPE